MSDNIAPEVSQRQLMDFERLLASDVDTAKGILSKIPF